MKRTVSAGKPMAVVIPAARYEALVREREQLWTLVEEAQARNRDVPLDVIEAEVAEAIAEVRGAAAAPTSARA